MHATIEFDFAQSVAPLGFPVTAVPVLLEVVDDRCDVSAECAGAQQRALAFSVGVLVTWAAFEIDAGWIGLALERIHDDLPGWEL
jgi:hypothetical protein